MSAIAHPQPLPFRFASVALFIAGCLLLALAGQWLTQAPSRDATIFLAGGLYFVAVLSSPQRDWLRWTLVIGTVEIGLETGLYRVAALPALVDALGHALGVLAAAHVVRIVRGLPFRLMTMADVLVFALAAAVVHPTVGVVPHMAHLAFAGKTFEIWGLLGYWMAQAVGALVMAPLLLSLRQHVGALRTVSLTKWLEGALMIALLYAILHIIFSGRHPVVFLALPMIVWAAVRFGMVGVVLVMTLFMAVIVRYTASGMGPYGVAGAAGALLAQSFLALTTICALCLAAIIEQYQAAQRALRQARDHLEQRVLERTSALAYSEQQLRDRNEMFAIARAAAKLITLEWIIESDTLTFSDDPVWLRGPLPASGKYPLFRDQVHPDDLAHFLRMRQRALDTLRGGAVEFRLVRTDSVVIWVQSYQTVFADAQGKAIRLVAAIQDISARKQNEISLRESEQRLRALLDGIPARAWLKDAQGRFIAVNRAQEDMYELPAATLIGKTIFEVRPVEIAERVAAEDRMVRTAAKPMHFERQSSIRGDWVEITKVPIFGANGEYAGIVGIWQDITKRKQAEQEALLASEQRYRTLVDATAQSIWTLDAKGDLASVIKSISGERVDKRHARQWLDFVHPDDRAGAAAALEAAMLGKQVYLHEHRVLDDNGGWLDVVSRAAPVVHADGTVREWIGTSTDVSKQKKAERALRESYQLLRRLSGRREALLEAERARIAHNLHDGAAQTLNVVRLKLAAIVATADEKTATALREILDAIDQVNHELRSLEFELSPPVLRQLGLVPALRWLSEEMQRSYGLTVSVSDDGEDKTLDQENRAATFRAVRELLINVAKHAKVSAAHVDAQRVGGTMKITVSDMGEGFDTEGLDTVHAGPGAAGGLGLVMVKERIEFSGGRVHFESAPGAGTVSTIVMPLERAGS